MRRIRGFAFFSFLPFCALAQGTLDQQFIPNPVLYVQQARQNDYAGQTFTAGVSGTLTRLDLLIAREAGVTQGMDVYVEHKSGSSADPIISFSVPASSLPIYNMPPDPSVMTSFDVSPFRARVVAGETYVILVHSSIPFNLSPKINWFGTGDQYPGGSRVQLTSLPFSGGADTTTDFGFRTFVAIPEPSSFSLFAILGSPLIALWVRCRKTRLERFDPAHPIT